MKRMIGALALVTLAFTATTLQAQDRRGGGPGPRIDEQIEGLTERLELTNEQADKIKGVLETQGEKRRKLFQGRAQDMVRDRRAMRTVIMEMQEEMNAILSEILAEDQMVKYEAILEARRQRRGPPPF